MLITQALIFGVLLPLYGLFSQQEVSFEVWAGVFLYAVIHGLFIAGIAAVIGYPVFRKMLSLLKFKYFVTIFLTGMSSVCVVALAFSAFWQAYTYPFKHEIFGIKEIFVVSLPILLIGAVASIVYWAVTRSLNNKLQNTADGGLDATEIAPV